MIRFPQRPMADSVTERIMRFMHEQQAQANSVASQGARLDAALQQPIGDVAPVEGIEDALVLNSLDI